MMKTIERAHTPRKMWEKVRLAKSYAGALEQIDKQLEFWPKFLVHKNKQRLTKITQYLIRARRLALRPKPTLVPLATRTEQRERRREKKAEMAARLETSIEGELLARLRGGTYGDIYNFPAAAYDRVLDAAEAEAAAAEGDEYEYVEGESEEEEEEEEGVGGAEWVSDGPSDSEGEEGDAGDDMEDMGAPLRPKRGRKEVEVEVERARPRARAAR
jgi:protein MAK16